MHTTPSAPEKFVIAALVVFGLAVALATPLSAGYDEETHLIRAWEMAHLSLVPNERLGAKLPFPALYWELSYRRQPLVEAVKPGFWSRYGALPLDAHDYVYANVETRSVYSPVLLLPQAIALRYLGLSLRLPALAVYYGCRIAGLLAYALLCWLAVRIIPYGKWLLAILTLSPMAVFQASTISADTISNGIAFLFVAGVLAIVSAHAVDWKQFLLLLGLVALLFVAKVNLTFLALLPFLLLRPSRFRMKHGLVLLAVAVLVLILVEVIGWNLLAYSKFTRALEGASPREQVLFILANPLAFVKILARDIWINTPAYMRGWIGVYGYDYWPVPALTYLVYPAAVAIILWRPGDQVLPDRHTRIVLGSLFVVGFLLTIVTLYIAFTPVGSTGVAGVQGRYFTPVMPLLFLALLGIPGTSRGPTNEKRSIAPPSVVPTPQVPAALASFALMLFVVGLFLSYHVPCGSEYYRWSLCYQPRYKNWAPESVSSPPISSSLTLTQEIVPACDGMTELSVWVNSAGADPGGITSFTLRAPTQERDLVQADLKNADILEGGWLTVAFPPERSSNEQLYLLKIVGSTTGGIRVGYSEKPEYLEGRLLENDIAIGSDILFQYGCIAGLQKIFDAYAPFESARLHP